jgi:hypothetical protein
MKQRVPGEGLANGERERLASRNNVNAGPLNVVGAQGIEPWTSPV